MKSIVSFALMSLLTLNACTSPGNDAQTDSVEGEDLTTANNETPVQCILPGNACEQALKDLLTFSLQYLFQVDKEMARVGVVHLHIPEGKSGWNRNDTFSYNTSLLPNSASTGSSTYPLSLPSTLGQEDANMLYQELTAAYDNALTQGKTPTNYEFVGCEETGAETVKSDFVHWLTQPALGASKKANPDSPTQCSYPFDRPDQGVDLSVKFVLALDSDPKQPPRVSTVRQFIYVSPNTSSPFRKFGVYRAVRPFGEQVHLTLQPSHDENAKEPKTFRTMFPVSTDRGGLKAKALNGFSEDARAVLGMNDPPEDLWALSEAWNENRISEGKATVGKMIALTSLAGFGLSSVAPFVTTLIGSGLRVAVAPLFAQNVVSFVVNAGLAAFVIDDLTTLGDLNKIINAIPDKEHRVLCKNAYLFLKFASLASLGGAVKNAGKIDQLSTAVWQDIHVIVEGFVVRRWLQLHHLKSLVSLGMNNRRALQKLVETMMERVKVRIGSASTPQQIGKWFNVETTISGWLTIHTDELIRDFDSVRVALDNPALANVPPSSTDNSKKK